jgi:Xaa-Pro aminopeptidase
MWTQQQIQYHKKASKLLIKIKDSALEHISENKNISEYEVRNFILKQFDKYNLITEKDKPIVAFAENTAFMHYFPKQKSKKLAPETLILIDIWAKLKIKDAPFADITWMAYYGKKFPARMKKVFDTVIKAKNKCLKHIESRLADGIMPTGHDVENVANQVIINSGFGKNILHSTGHSLGTVNDHGTHPGITKKNEERIYKNLGYTIEPGIYLEGKFGVRSEIDFYISSGNKLILTTDSQQEITMI